jgi:hypothetical protein
MQGVLNLVDLRWDRTASRLTGHYASADYERAGIGVVNFRTGRLEKLTSSGEGQTAAVSPAWSPSGKWIAFERQERIEGGRTYSDNLFVMPSSGGRPVRINSEDSTIDECSKGRWSWHATRDTLVFTQAPASGSGPVELCAVTYSQYGRKAASSIPLDLLGPRRDLSRIYVVPSPVGSRVALWPEWIRGRSAIWVADISRGTVSPLPLESDAERPPEPLRMLADGRLAVLEYRDGGGHEQPARVVTVDMDTGRRIAALPLSARSRAWMFTVSAAGRFVYWYDLEAHRIMRSPLAQWRPEVVYRSAWSRE